MRPLPLPERLRRSRFWPMLWKEFIQMRRDRLTLAMMVVIPAVQLVLFGYAIRTEVRHLPTVVLDEARTSDSRALVDVLRNTGDFDVVAHVGSRRAVDEQLASGRASAALVVPPDFTHDLKRGRTAQAQVVVDASDPMASSAAMAGAAMAGQARSAQIVSAAAGRPAPLDVRVRPRYNPGLESAIYIVPGIIGVLLSMTMLIITAIAIVRERERGTLEQLIVTPIDKLSLMLGKILPFVLVGFVQVTVVLGLGRLLFDIPVRGSLVLLYVISFAFIVDMLGVGIFVSTVVRTQAQAIQLGFFFMLPTILLSGFMFPRQAMPVAAQWLGLVMPLTYYLRILRGILLKGVGMEYLWPDTLALIGFAVVIITASVKRFSKTIE